MASAVHPSEHIRQFVKEHNIDDLTSVELAKKLDEVDELRKYRDEFCYPKMKTLPRVDQSKVNGEDDCIYFCSHSLGLCPKAAEKYVVDVIHDWQKMGAESYFYAKVPVSKAADPLIEPLAKIVGAKPIEVAIAHSLTVNLNLMMVTFYQPTIKRHKVLIEAGAFPSDYIAVEAQIRYHGFELKDSLLEARPRKGENCIRTSDLVELIEKEGEEIALILLPGIQYYTGQLFDMKTITEVGHKKGCKVGFDLGHAVGNVLLSLHDWEVDFACWCSYKYLCGSAGSAGGLFVHEKFANDGYNLKRLAGWWGVDWDKRFAMDNADLQLTPGAAGFAMSTPSMFTTMGMYASLQLFHEIGMNRLVKKQRLLTGYLELLINLNFNESDDNNDHVTIITPLDVESRGCQLSFAFEFSIDKVHIELIKRGVLCDVRKPKALRIAPAPMYNSFNDVYQFIDILKKVIVECRYS